MLSFIGVDFPTSNAAINLMSCLPIQNGDILDLQSSPIRNPSNRLFSDPVQSKSTWTGLDSQSGGLIQSIPVHFMSILDISRYFEKIWHRGLLSKCKTEFGVTGQVLRWLKSYLTGRSQTVQVGTKRSTPLSLNPIPVRGGGGAESAPPPPEGFLVLFLR